MPSPEPAGSLLRPGQPHLIELDHGAGCLVALLEPAAPTEHGEGQHHSGEADWNLRLLEEDDPRVAQASARPGIRTLRLRAVISPERLSEDLYELMTSDPLELLGALQHPARRYQVFHPDAPREQATITLREPEQ